MPSRPVSPYLYALGVFFFVALMNACVKGLHNEVPLSLITLSRFGIGFLMFVPAVLHTGGFAKVLRTHHPRKQAGRAILSMTGVAITFYAIPLLPLGDATALWNTLAFFLLLLSGPLLSEKIDLKHYGVCAIGFIGVLFIAHPHGTGQALPIIAMLIAALIAATTTLTVRLMSRDDSELTILTWMFGVSMLVSFVWWAGFAPKEALTLNQGALLIGAGLFGSVSQLSMTRAMRTLGAQALGPYTYSGILFSTVMGFLFFDEVPTLWMLVGALFIISGVQLSYRLDKKEKSA